MIQEVKNILVLGAGYVSEPCVEFLLKREENRVIVGSDNLQEAEYLVNKLNLHNSNKFKNSDRIKVVEINVIKQKDKLYELIKMSDFVISLIPSSLHIFVAHACLDLEKNLLTTSYISEEIKKLDKKVKEKNLTFMFEIGVNPGLDHILAFKVIREQEELGNMIVGYESWVSAVPSPECIDNPLLYKFSFNPKASLENLMIDAKQLINGKVITIPGKHLLTTFLVDKKFHPSLNLEGFYNRDSIRYKELYNLKHAKSVIRGGIRYQGFTFVIQCFKFLNLISNDPISSTTVTWRDHLNKILKNPRIQDNIYEVKNKYMKKGLEMFVYNQDLSDKLVERIFYYNLSLLALSYFEDRYIRKYVFENLFNRIYSVLLYLEFFKEENKILCKDSVIDALSILLEKKIGLKQDQERDLMFMQNEFQIKNKNGRIFNKKYDLIVFGGHNRLPYTATSTLVGFPAAITAQVEERGIIIPSSPIIVETVLDELKKNNIFFHETIELKAKF